MIPVNFLAFFSSHWLSVSISKWETKKLHHIMEHSQVPMIAKDVKNSKKLKVRFENSHSKSTELDLSPYNLLVDYKKKI